MKKALSVILALALCLSLGTAALASGEASGGGSVLTGMLSLKSYVVENDGNDTVSYEVYGLLTDGAESDAAAYVIDRDADLAALKFTVYADREMTEEADGVTATYADGFLTLSGVTTDVNTAYYVGSDYPAENVGATVLYVVNDQYTADVEYALEDGTTIVLSKYAPGIASQSASNIYIGANTTLLTAADYGITDEKDAAIADWWLSSGITNAGITLDEFGDTFHRFELMFDIYRQFQIVIDQDTTVVNVGGAWADPADSNPAQPTNDQYSDATSATIYAGVWDGIYTTMNAEGYLENIPGVTTIGVGDPVDEEILFVLLYNAFVSPWSRLNDEGKAIAADLNAADNAAKVAQMKAALGMEDWAIENYTTQKLAVLDVLKTVDQYVAMKDGPDAALQATAQAAGYAIVDQATADMASLIEQLSARVIEEDTVINGEDIATDLPTALFVKDGKVSITDATVVSSGSNTGAGKAGASAQELLSVASGMPATSSGGYNMTTANAYYRDGFGAELTAWGHDTIIELTTTNGELVVSGPSNGSMAGAFYNGFGASILVKNAVAYSGGQHLSNTVYNGTIHYLDACAIGAGRMYSSDFWGGNVVFENTVSSGGNVTDEPTAAIIKNGVYNGSGQIHGYATMYFENAIIENGGFTTKNNTSLVSDASTVTLVNTVMEGSSLLNVQRSSHNITTLVDSQVNLTADLLAKLSNVYSGEQMYTAGNLGDAFYDVFQTQVKLYTYGINGINFVGDELTVNVGKDQTMTLYVSEIIGGEIRNIGEGTFEVVYGDEYGVLYLNTEYDRPVHGAAAPSAEPSGEATGEADGSNWDAWIAYLKGLIDSNIADIADQVAGELDVAREEDYTGMLDGTVYGVFAFMYDAIPYEEFQG